MRGFAKSPLLLVRAETDIIFCNFAADFGPLLLTIFIWSDTYENIFISRVL